MKTKAIIVTALLLGAAMGAKAQVDVTKVDATHYTFEMPDYDVEVTTELYYKLDATETLADNKTAYDTKTNFFLDRTLTKDVWNTFASPFAIAADKMEAYFGAGAKVRKLGSTTIEEGNILSLNFVTASSIEAGKPYIVKPTAADVDFSADGKEFEGVDLTAASASADNTTYVNFVATLGKTTVTGNVDDILIMNTSGTLVHPTAVGDMKGFRGYFVLHDASQARAFSINFGDGKTTGIIPIRTENGTVTTDGMTFDLQGRKVAQPTQKGVYIQNGKKVIIK